MMNFGYRNRQRGLFGGGLDRFDDIAEIARRPVPVAAPRMEEEPRRRRGGLIGSIGRRIFGEDNRFFGDHEDGTTFSDRMRMAGMSLQGDSRGAEAIRQGIRERQEQANELALAQQAQREQREATVRQAQAMGLQGRKLTEFMFLPEEIRNERLSAFYAPEETVEPNLREFNGNLYDMADLSNPRLVMQGSQPAPRQRDIREDANGRARYVDTGELVFPDVEVSPSGDFNAQQTQAAEYASRMVRANNTLEAILSPQDEGQEGYDPTARARARNIPLVGDTLRGDVARQFDQAADEFALAVLRRESGAAISASERAEVAALYFPQPGDGPGVVEQKRQARLAVIDGMQRASGGAYGSLFGQQQEAPRSFSEMTDEELERIANGG